MEISVGGSVQLNGDPANLLNLDLEVSVTDAPILGDILNIDIYRGPEGYGYSDSITLGSGLDTITFLNSEPGDPPGAPGEPVLGIEGLYLGQVGVSGLLNTIVDSIGGAVLEPVIEAASPLGGLVFAGLLPALPGLPMPGLPDTGLGTILDLGDGTHITVPNLGL